MSHCLRQVSTLSRTPLQRSYDTLHGSSKPSSEHDRHRTDGCTQDSLKKCPKHAEKHSRTTRSSYRP
eukprot:Em0001g510a